VAELRGLITDWGGVLTTPLKGAIQAWLTADRIDVDGYRTVMREWVKQAYAAQAGANPIHGLEDGSIEPAEFERLLAARLRTTDATPVQAAGLLARMFASFEPVQPMYDLLRRAKAAGVRTCLLSNSWGNVYPRELFAELFDAVVISSEVRLRKPDPEIFRRALELLELRAEECVFVDDIAHNVEAAQDLGIIGIHHVEVESTVAEVEGLFGFES
jgi:putative hydrolase of the HAD superfamily